MTKKRTSIFVLIYVIYIIIGYILEEVSLPSGSLFLSLLYELWKRLYIVFLVEEIHYIYKYYKTASMKDLLFLFLVLLVVVIIHLPFYNSLSVSIIEYDLPTLLTMLAVALIGCIIKMIYDKKMVKK